jgi:ankyrin repeat protein
MKPSASRTARGADKPVDHSKAAKPSGAEATATAAAGRKPGVPSRIATYISSSARRSAASQAVAPPHDLPDPAPASKYPPLPPEDTGLTQQDFFAAIIEGNADRVAECIAHGVDVRPHGNATHHTPILLACRLGRTNVLPLLIGAGADLESADRDGKTSLMAATERNRTSIMSVLLDGGASFWTVDSHYRTLVMMAIINGSHEAAIRLLHAGVPVDATDSTRRTALTYAQLHNSPADVVTLLAAGANFMDGWWPRDHGLGFQ